ncbi:MAG: methionyl-tRNA formyltransferase, partial [Defluviitaleaceae bacterium]|nr:methionyl-tRNA formyltransferase [Defluviitaleaceae bacterium]
GGKLAVSAVKARASLLGLPCLQPERIKDADAVRLLREFNADIFVVAAYGQILSREILDMPRLGCVNVHASLLPKYRGAAPINRAIINGEAATGITIMQMDVGLDTGDMLLAEEIAIEADDNAGSLHDKLAALGASALCRALEQIAGGLAKPVPQDNDRATYAHMLTKETGRVDWNADAASIANLVRGLAPRPCAWTRLNGETFKIYAAEADTAAEASRAPGEIVVAGPRGIGVAAGGGVLYIREIQRQNGKRLAAEEFLRGNSLTPGEKFENC